MEQNRMTTVRDATVSDSTVKGSPVAEPTLLGPKDAFSYDNTGLEIILKE